jgi:hypothetical protein
MNVLDKNDETGSETNSATRGGRSMDKIPTQLAAHASRIRGQLPTLKWEGGRKMPALDWSGGRKPRPSRVLGIAIGERSLLAAEITAGEQPAVRLLQELVYPEGVTLQNPAALGEALAKFLTDNNFTAKSAVIGLPARWLLVKSKEVPPADPATLHDLLRLQAEGEFSSELRDLVYDYTADTSAGPPRSVLLVATSGKYIAAIQQICEAARISPLMVTSSAIALGAATNRGGTTRNSLVLLVNSYGAELTAQSGDTSSAIRHMRPPTPDKPFVGELRRTISGLPHGADSNGSSRELVLWDGGGGYNFTALNETLGIPVRTGDLPLLGVQTSVAQANGEGRKYAAAVALGLLALNDTPTTVDFLHSRLAAPTPPLLPRWAVIAITSAVLVLALVVTALVYQSQQQSKLNTITAQVESVADQVKSDQAFVNKVTIARAWHMGTNRYLPCLRDLTRAMPNDGQTYALSLTIHETAPPSNNSAAPGTATAGSFAVKDLNGTLEGKTTDQHRVLLLLDALRGSPAFSNVKLNGTNDAGKNREIIFTITFNYSPGKAGK